MKPAKWFLISYRCLIAASLALIALGGATRAMNAGLSCPDWPLCFWQIVPDKHYEVYYEFLHRTLAGLVGIAVVVFQGYLAFHSKSKPITRIVAVSSIVVLLTQIVLGALTVLKLLEAKVVTLHLAFGILLFALLLWNYWQVQGAPAKSNRIKVSIVWLGFLIAAIYGQIILGGMVSTNYAGLACPDFPLCQGRWIPTLQGPVGLHVMHRFGAYSVAILVALNFFLVRRKQRLGAEMWMLILVGVQILLGIANVIFQIPPLITVLHLVTGASLLGFALRQLHSKSA